MPNGFTYHAKGRLLAKQGKFPDAVDTLRKAAEMPSFVPVRQVVYFDLAKTLEEGWTDKDLTWIDHEREWQYRQALMELAKFGPLPDHPEADLLAVSAAYHGEPAIAEVLGGSYLRAEPDSPRSLQLKFHISVAERNYTNAYDIAAKLEKLAPKLRIGQRHRDRAVRRLQSWFADHPEVMLKP
jgi:tetratricopeptide (TPR) repeat protein